MPLAGLKATIVHISYDIARGGSLTGLNNAVFSNEQFFLSLCKSCLCICEKTWIVTSSRIHSLMAHMPSCCWVPKCGVLCYKSLYLTIYIQNIVRFVLLSFLQQEGDVMFQQDNVYSHHACITLLCKVFDNYH